MSGGQKMVYFVFWSIRTSPIFSTSTVAEMSLTLKLGEARVVQLFSLRSAVLFAYPQPVLRTRQRAKQSRVVAAM